MDTLDPVAVADLHARPPGGLREKLVPLALLILVPLIILGAASVIAFVVVRVGADLRLGLNPLMDERVRPRLPIHEMAARGIAVDVVRQIVIMLLVIALALWSDGVGWRRRLALVRPAEARVPIPRVWRFWLLLLVWPVIHIGWVTGTAQALHVGFGRGVTLSPFLTPALVVWWAVYVALLAPVAEELLLRGEAFARAASFMKPAGVIVSTALLFCVLHVSEMGFVRPITLLPLAITLGWLRWRTGRLWPGMLLHGWSNIALVAYLLWPSVR